MYWGPPWSLGAEVQVALDRSGLTYPRAFREVVVGRRRQPAGGEKDQDQVTTSTELTQGQRDAGRALLGALVVADQEGVLDLLDERHPRLYTRTITEALTLLLGADPATGWPTMPDETHRAVLAEVAACGLVLGSYGDVGPILRAASGIAMKLAAQGVRASTAEVLAVWLEKDSRP